MLSHFQVVRLQISLIVQHWLSIVYASDEKVNNQNLCHDEA